MEDLWEKKVTTHVAREGVPLVTRETNEKYRRRWKSQQRLLEKSVRVADQVTLLDGLKQWGKEVSGCTELDGTPYLRCINY